MDRRIGPSAGYRLESCYWLAQSNYLRVYRKPRPDNLYSTRKILRSSHIICYIYSLSSEIPFLTLYIDIVERACTRGIGSFSKYYHYRQPWERSIEIGGRISIVGETFHRKIAALPDVKHLCSRNRDAENAVGVSEMTSKTVSGKNNRMASATKSTRNPPPRCVQRPLFSPRFYLHSRDQSLSMAFVVISDSARRTRGSVGGHAWHNAWNRVYRVDGVDRIYITTSDRTVVVGTTMARVSRDPRLGDCRVDDDISNRLLFNTARKKCNGSIFLHERAYT